MGTSFAVLALILLGNYIKVNKKVPEDAKKLLWVVVVVASLLVILSIIL